MIEESESVSARLDRLRNRMLCKRCSRPAAAKITHGGIWGGRSLWVQSLACGGCYEAMVAEIRRDDRVIDVTWLDRS
ncbi:hypothetical protein [Tsukamurella sp. USMM236]|uniref:hypothetical protein n=1 Tax=Tsukamurella sp. USMM236 TaxID=3081301 RepID=UPI00301A0176